MQTAIATVCLSGTLNEKLEAIAAARFKGVEIFENDLLSFDGSPAEIGQEIKRLGLEAVTFQPFRDFEGMPEPQRAKVFSRAERKFDLMAQLGCDLLMVCSNVSPGRLAASTGRQQIFTSSATELPSEAAASLSRRWPGVATSMIIAIPGGRPAGGSSCCRSRARQLSRAGARHRAQRNPRDSQGSHLSGSDRRRQARHGLLSWSRHTAAFQDRAICFRRSWTPCRRRV